MHVYNFHFQQDSEAPLRKQKKDAHVYINLPQQTCLHHIFAFMVQPQRVIMAMLEFVNLAIITKRDILQ